MFYRATAQNSLHFPANSENNSEGAGFEPTTLRKLAQNQMLGDPVPYRRNRETIRPFRELNPANQGIPGKYETLSAAGRFERRRAIHHTCYDRNIIAERSRFVNAAGPATRP
jgi:hypothetical protein